MNIDDFYAHNKLHLKTPSTSSVIDNSNVNIYPISTTLQMSTDPLMSSTTTAMSTATLTMSSTSPMTTLLMSQPPCYGEVQVLFITQE